MPQIRFPAKWLDLIESGEMEPIELVALCAIMEYDWTANTPRSKGYIRGYTELAKRIGRSRRQTIRLVKQMEEKGWIQVIKNGKKGNTLLVSWASLPSDTDDTSVVTPMTLPGVTHVTQKKTKRRYKGEEGEGIGSAPPKTVFHLVEGKKDDDDWFKDIAHLFR